ncbi:MAG: ABC transporter substrate-binding protein [Pseudomonadota bacterium]
MGDITLHKTFLNWCLAVLLAILPLTAFADEIVIVIGSEPTTLDPHAADDGGEKAVNDNVFETLMVRDTEGNLGLGLAAEEPTQVDATTWEFKLQPGITFHNGEPLDAAAVAFSVERMIDPELNSEQLSYFSTMAGAEVIDDVTVHIKTSGPDPILPARMYYFMIVPPEASQADDFAEAPVGSGPFKFVSWDRGNEIVLEADPEYRGGAPDVTQVTYRFIEEPGTRLSTLLAGEVDLVTNLLPEFMAQVPQAASMRGLEHPMVLLNADGGITADTRVRQALNYAIDKEALASALFEGQAQVEAGQLLGPTYFGFNEEISAYPYDPDRAMALLEEAGAAGGEITLVSTAGRWLKDRELTEVVAGFWSAVGLNVDVQIYEFDEYLQRLFRSEDGQRADAIFVVSGNELLDADRSFSAYLAPSGFGASNSIDQLEEWITAARTEIDLEARQALYEQVVEYAHEEALLTFLLNINNIWGMSERLSWEPRVDGKMFVSTMTVE